MTDSNSLEIREILRSSWFPNSPESMRSALDETGLEFRFVIDRSDVTDEIIKEEQKYGEFLKLDYDPPSDVKRRSSRKTLEFFREALRRYDAKFYIKVSLKPISPSAHLGRNIYLG